MVVVRMASSTAEYKYPAKAHASRVVAHIASKNGGHKPTGMLYLEARHTRLLEDNDEAERFRQRRYFYYLTGCNLADSYAAYDIGAKKLTLFIPPVNPDSVIWSGLPVSREEAMQKWDVDEVKYTTELNDFLSSAGAKATVFAIEGQVSDHVSLGEFHQKDFTVLKKAIETCRVVKDEYEVGQIRKANEVTAEAHHAVMRRAKTASNEAEIEAAFLERCVSHNAKEMAYHGIAASGRAASTLHYVKNNQPLGGKLNVLMDAGAEWECYCSDVTRTFPLSGVFSPESRAIYNIVLKMQRECMAALKADVVWEDLHTLAHRIAIDGLLRLGILKGDEKEIFDKRISVAFFPHGLGHHLGLDTHDTGGNPNYEDKDVMFRYLRIRGKVPAGSVVTVEPGVYFCNFIIEPYLDDKLLAKYIDTEVLDRYWDVGGVRIEDNLLVTEDGCENLTTAIKEADDVENLVIT